MMMMMMIIIIINTVKGKMSDENCYIKITGSTAQPTGPQFYQEMPNPQLMFRLSIKIME